MGGCFVARIFASVLHCCLLLTLPLLAVRASPMQGGFFNLPSLLEKSHFFFFPVSSLIVAAQVATAERVVDLSSAVYEGNITDPFAAENADLQEATVEVIEGAKGVLSHIDRNHITVDPTAEVQAAQALREYVPPPVGKSFLCGVRLQRKVYLSHLGQCSFSSVGGVAWRGVVCGV